VTSFASTKIEDLTYQGRTAAGTTVTETSCGAPNNNVDKG
jgi:hypothetical protein